MVACLVATSTNSLPDSQGLIVLRGTMLPSHCRRGNPLCLPPPLETDVWALVVVGLAKAGDGSHCAICIPIINGDGLEMEGR